jgi:hypothetical protein
VIGGPPQSGHLSRVSGLQRGHESRMKFVCSSTEQKNRARVSRGGDRWGSQIGVRFHFRRQALPRIHV